MENQLYKHTNNDQFQEQPEFVALSDKIKLQAKKDSSGREFHISLPNNTMDIIHCFNDKQHEAVVSADHTNTTNTTIIIYPENTPVGLGVYQSIIMKALNSVSNQDITDPHQRTLIDTFLHTYKRFDLTKNQAAIARKKLQKEGGEQEIILEKIKKLIDLFDGEKQQYIQENTKIKEIHEQINEIQGNEKHISKILSHPQAGAIIQQCKKLHSYIIKIKEIEQKCHHQQNSLEGKEQQKSNLVKTIEKLNTLTSNPSYQKLTPSKQKQKLGKKNQKVKILQQQIKLLEEKIEKNQGVLEELLINLYEQNTEKGKTMLWLSKKSPVINEFFNTPWKTDRYIMTKEQEILEVQTSINKEQSLLQTKQREINSQEATINRIKKLIETSKKRKEGYRGDNTIIRKNRTLSSTQQKKKIDSNNERICNENKEIDILKQTLEEAIKGKEKLIQSYLTPEDALARDNLKKNIDQANKTIKELNKKRNNMKKNYYKEEIQPLIAEKRNDIAQRESSIKKITQSIFTKETQTIAKYEEEKDKIWKDIVSGKQKKITTNRHLEECISIIAGLNNEEITQHGVQPSKQQPYQQRLSKQIGEHQTHSNDHQNKKETIEHSIKNIVAQYVLELESYKNSLERWMKDTTEFYQISRSYKNGQQEEEESHTIDQKMQTLASLRNQKCHQIETRQSSINKTSLIFLSEGSGHNKDITILYQSINNLLRWSQIQEGEKNRLIKELTQIQTQLSNVNWDRFSHDQGVVYPSEGKEGTKQELTEQKREEKIGEFEDQIKKYNNILKEIGTNGNIKETQKTRERINEIQQEINSINKEIKATKNTNEQKNIDKKESGDDQNHTNDQKAIELSKKENSIKQTIQRLETKKAMIQSFEKITKGLGENIY